MLTHSDRRATLCWTKIGPPYGSCHEARQRRRGTCSGNQPALRAVPIRQAS